MKTSYIQTGAKKYCAQLLFCVFIALLPQIVNGQLVYKKFKPGATIGEDALLYTSHGCTPSGYPAPVEGLNFGNIDEINIFAWTLGYLSCTNGTRRSVLRFTELSTLPAGTIKVIDAKLNLFCVSSSPTWGTSHFPGSPYPLENPGWVERVTGSWTETGVTWNTQPSTTAYNRVPISKSNARWGWNTSIDVKNLLNDLLASGSNDGFMLKLQTEAFYRATLFASSDHTDTSLWPELVIIYDTLCSSSLARFKDSTVDCRNIQFSDISSASLGTSIVSWSWDFGDGGTSVLQKPSHTYAAFGTYNVRLIVDGSSGCKDTFTKSVVVSPLRFASFIDAKSSCIGKQFTGISSISPSRIASWYWDFGDGTNSTLQSPNHTFPGYGTYLVKLFITTTSGCTDTAGKFIVINRTRFADFKDSSTTCFQKQFIDISSIVPDTVVSWKWDFGDGGMSTSKNPVHTFPGYGAYAVKLMVENSLGCKDTISRVVRLNRAYFADFRDSATSCFQRNFRDTSNEITGGLFISWKWDFGDGGTSTLKNPTHTFPGYGSYTVRQIVENSKGCLDTMTRVINIVFKPFANAGNDTGFCIENGKAKIQLNAMKGHSAYSWTPSDGLINALSASPSGIISESTTFMVRITDSFGCFDSAFVNILLHTPPTITAQPKDTAVCIETEIQLAASGGLSYQWSPATDLDNAGISMPRLKVSKAATYVVKGTDENGCSAYDTVQVRLLPSLGIVATPKNSLACYGGKIMLNVSGATSFKWYPATGLNRDDIANPEVTVLGPATYIVRGINQFGCPGFDSVFVDRYADPEIEAYSSENVIRCKSNEIKLMASGGLSYAWSPAEYCDNPASEMPLVNPPKTTVFTVTGTDENGCTGKDTISVLFVGKSEVYLPNAFTPNGDGRNDVYKILDQCNFVLTSFNVYSRWGTNIFTANDIKAGWDGKYNGQEQELGVYFYLVKGKTLDGEELIFKGDFTLIR